MKQIVGELVVEANADYEPLRSRILYLQLPGQNRMDSVMMGSVEKVGLFCYVLKMGIIDVTCLYHHMRDGRDNATNHRRSVPAGDQ